MIKKQGKGKNKKIAEVPSKDNIMLIHARLPS